jgi:hypothetical protein
MFIEFPDFLRYPFRVFHRKLGKHGQRDNRLRDLFRDGEAGTSVEAFYVSRLHVDRHRIMDGTLNALLPQKLHETVPDGPAHTADDILVIDVGRV